MMEIISVEILNKTKLVITLHIWAVIVLIILCIAISLGIKCFLSNTRLKSICIDEAKIGIGNSYITVKYDKRIQNIAYRIWVELNTRKIGIMFDEENDVITEVYNSWYKAFNIIRDLLEEVPVERINDAKGLVEITTKVLNDGLRPHLTKWQAKYRNWYDDNKVKYNGKTPQEIQKNYPQYEELISDLKQTNQVVIKFSEELKKIAYGIKNQQDSQ